MSSSISDKGIILGDTAAAPQLFSITASVASNSLTVTLAPSTVAFRNATLGTGGVQTVQNTAAISIIVPSGATLGTTNATLGRLYVLALNNVGTMELAVVNAASNLALDETGLISTTAISAGASSASTVYSVSARTNVPYRVIGFIESTQATAGTWATAPSLIQGTGGQALVSLVGLQTLGFNQSWQSVTRTVGTTYYNTTGKPIAVSTCAVTSGNTSYSGIVNGSTAVVGYANSYYITIFFIVPPGGSYYTSGSVTLTNWFELR